MEQSLGEVIQIARGNPVLVLEATSSTPTRTGHGSPPPPNPLSAPPRFQLADTGVLAGGGSGLVFGDQRSPGAAGNGQGPAVGRQDTV